MLPNACRRCAGCCNHVAMEIDAPEDEESIDDIKWYLLHENVRVFTDEECDWYVEFETPCSALTKDHECSEYENRPNICREYDPGNCEGGGEYWTEMFTNTRQFTEYIKRKPVKDP